MEAFKGLLALVRVRHMGQVVGIVSLLNLKSNGCSIPSLLTIASYMFLSIALFSFDDAYDFASDSIAHPGRPIPKGIFTSRQVYLIGAVSLSLGIALMSSLTLYQLVLFLVITMLGLVVIFTKLKSVLRATLTASMIFMLFPANTADLKNMLFGLIVVLPHIAGSIAKDYMHSRGDERIGLESPPEWARYLSSLLFFVAGGITMLPVILNHVTWLYVLLILPTFVSCLTLGSKVLFGKYEKVYIYGGIGMISSLVAFATNI